MKVPIRLHWSVNSQSALHAVSLTAFFAKQNHLENVDMFQQASIWLVIKTIRSSKKAMNILHQIFTFFHTKQLISTFQNKHTIYFDAWNPKITFSKHHQFNTELFSFLKTTFNTQANLPDHDIMPFVDTKCHVQRSSKNKSLSSYN